MAKKSQPIEAPLLDGVHILLTGLEASGADESIVIENLGTVAQPLTNWVLSNVGADRSYTLPEGTILAPGARLTIHSGPGASGGAGADLLWTQESVWNNKGATAVLFDANGHEVARVGHGAPGPKEVGEKMLFREDGDMHIEDSAPEKKVNLKWDDPVNLDPEGSE